MRSSGPSPRPTGPSATLRLSGRADRASGLRAVPSWRGRGPAGRGSRVRKGHEVPLAAVIASALAGQPVARSVHADRVRRARRRRPCRVRPGRAGGGRPGARPRTGGGSRRRGVRGDRRPRERCRVCRLPGRAGDHHPCHGRHRRRRRLRAARLRPLLAQTPGHTPCASRPPTDCARWATTSSTARTHPSPFQPDPGATGAGPTRQ